MNPLVDPWRLYEPLLKHILRDWQAKTVSVILDGSMVFGDRLQIFRLSLAHGSSTHIHLRTGRTIRLDALTIKPGRILCFNTVRLTLVHQFVTHVSITWSRGDATHDPELVILVSDHRANPDRLREYAVRMDIEQSFRDDKFAGFDIDHTRLQHPERLERLLLAVAIATIWCHELGEFVLQQDDAVRRLIDPVFSRELSLFQLGLPSIQHALAVLLDSLPPFRATLSDIDLSPVGVKV